jgi:ABC-2 type transport system permease protein
VDAVTLAIWGRAAHIKAMDDLAFSRPTVAPPPPRDFAGFNGLGFWTLYLKEVRRFWKVGTQTVLAPVVTTLLYMLVFVVAVGGGREAAPGVSFGQFVAPGLIMMGILNNAFANSSSSILQAKMFGLTSDFLTPPLSPLEQVLVTAITVLLLPGKSMMFSHVWAAFYFAIAASLLLGLLGMIAGLWAEKFDHIAGATNFIIMPMTFLSGTFYLVDRLPEPFRTLSHFNPFFYLIDGFRYGFIGHADSNITIGVVSSAVANIVLFAVCLNIFRTGWRLKS